MTEGTSPGGFSARSWKSTSPRGFSAIGTWHEPRRVQRQAIASTSPRGFSAPSCGSTSPEGFSATGTWHEPRRVQRQVTASTSLDNPKRGESLLRLNTTKGALLEAFEQLSASAPSLGCAVIPLLSLLSQACNVMGRPAAGQTRPSDASPLSPTYFAIQAPGQIEQTARSQNIDAVAQVSNGLPSCCHKAFDH